MDCYAEPSPEILSPLDEEIVLCRKCPRLVAWREEIGAVKRKSFSDQRYWARPVPNFGDPHAERLIVGLAPAAHGANRTGRMFTGDRSGDWLYRALYRAGIASQPAATAAADGLKLRGVLITASVHCAPPDNKPNPDEFEACRPYLASLLSGRKWKSILCLGGIAWKETIRNLKDQGLEAPRSEFSHGAILSISEGPTLVGSYHPSQQNTFTGRLTEPMLDEAIRAFLEA